jgi:hypothetical protein
MIAHRTDADLTYRAIKKLVELAQVSILKTNACGPLPASPEFLFRYKFHLPSIEMEPCGIINCSIWYHCPISL